MKKTNKTEASPLVPCSTFFHCPKCRDRRDAVDAGEPYPMCEICGARLIVQEEVSASANAVTSATPPVDERPPEAGPILQERDRRRRELDPRKDGTAILRSLITDFNAALQDPATTHAILTRLFNPFTREIINQIVVEGGDWRAAVGHLDAQFITRNEAKLESFVRWAIRPNDSAVPDFIEPETLTNHEPLSETEPNQLAAGRAASCRGTEECRVHHGCNEICLRTS